MRIAVMGTGGVGGYFGARLAQGGHEVAFVARGRQFEALRAHGLRVESPIGDVHLTDVEVTEEPAKIGPVDLVLFTVKLWDTAEAAEAIKPLLGEQTGVVSLQNGVVKDDILGEILGPEHIIGGVCYIAATIARPGLIRHSGTLQKMVFGEYDGSASPRVRQFRDACSDGGIDAEISDRIEETIWEKFVFLVGASGTTSLARSAIGPIRENPRSRAFLRDVMEEVVEVARAQGVPLPVGYAEERLAFTDQVPAIMTSSMYHDLERGNRLEVAWLSGDVVERGARLGVPTPCNRAIFDMLSIYSEGRTGLPGARGAPRDSGGHGDLNRHDDHVDRGRAQLCQEPGQRGPDKVGDQDSHPQGRAHRGGVQRPGERNGPLLRGQRRGRSRDEEQDFEKDEGDDPADGKQKQLRGIGLPAYVGEDVDGCGRRERVPVGGSGAAQGNPQRRAVGAFYGTHVT
jgi:2-dehydropantoate 2-reductase